ncbi:hypothetical protein SEA_BILLNYE_139 [Streptomyces phage BillNye]|uniref:Uncharacterized protein n=1 Tax=Streptomyces phage BillNye TaxID=2079426 RepID=A0A2L1IVX7_9CAUD|nr:hypothetical protein FDJ30_gp117 [Streptomyces phage BillNye]AVD99316.1 hypothetical protein SEA_BILLNYE_139 [Streptomyces phage BillNye]
MFRVGFVRRTAIRPMDVVEGILTTTMFLHGVWLVSPFFKPSSSASALILQGESGLPQIIGLTQVAVAGVHLYSLLRKPVKQEVIRRGAMFFMFTLYLFYGTSSLILFGLGKVNWVTTFALAFIAAVVYLRLKWEVSHDARN